MRFFNLKKTYVWVHLTGKGWEVYKRFSSNAVRPIFAPPASETGLIRLTLEQWLIIFGGKEFVDACQPLFADDVRIETQEETRFSPFEPRLHQ